MSLNLRASFDSHWRTWRNEIIVMRRKQSLDKQESAAASSIMQSRRQGTWKSAAYRWKIPRYGSVSSMFTSISTWRSALDGTRPGMLFRDCRCSAKYMKYTGCFSQHHFHRFSFRPRGASNSPTFIRRCHPETCKTQARKTLRPG